MNDQVAVSLKYQVICEQTAMVGVVKQKDKSTGEMQSYTVKAGVVVNKTYAQIKQEEEDETERRLERMMGMDSHDSK